MALYDRVYEEAITGQRIIHFRYIDEHGREVEEDRIDTVRFTHTATVDAITGETTFSEWTPRFYTFPEEDVPDVEGYTPDRDKIPEQTVYPNGENEEITVIYKPISYEETANVTRTVKFRYYTEDGDEASADVVQTVNLKRTYRLDPDTKERVYSEWEVTGVENEHPEIPEIDGFTHDLTAIPDFDVDMSDPKDGADVYVIYTALPITYTVTFTDGTGNVLKVQEGIPEHGSAEAPEVPVREGYTFDGWDREFDDVTSNLVVTAKWISNTEPEKRTHTVTYVDPNGTLYRQVVVEDGEAEPPAPEVSKDGFEFDGWDRSEDEDGNVTYTARWVEKETPTEPEKETEPTEPTTSTASGQTQTVVVGGKTVTVPAGASSTVVTNPETGQTQRVFVPLLRQARIREM